MKKDLENLKEIIELCKEEIKHNDENANAVIDLEDLKSLNNLINHYEDVIQENSKMKELLNTQARIAEILELSPNKKMVKFGTGYYTPKSITLFKAIDQDETLQLEYINATSLLKYRINGEDKDNV